MLACRNVILEPMNSYPEDYRHFDNLIWQVPAWTTAIFGLSIGAASSVLTSAQEIGAILPLEPIKTLSVFLFSVFLVLVVLGNVFIRFRLHQRTVDRPERKRVPKSWYMYSGQTALLFVMFLESALVLCFALVCAGTPLTIGWSLSLFFLFFGFGFVERDIRAKSRALKAGRDKAAAESAG